MATEEEKKERSTILKFEDGEKSYLIRQDKDKNLFINDEQIYNNVKQEQECNENKNKGYNKLKLFLAHHLVLDEEKYPDIQGSGSIDRIFDAIILRLFSDQPCQSSYFINTTFNKIEAPATKKSVSLPNRGSELMGTNFEDLIADLE
jgi:hypothetical protein